MPFPASHRRAPSAEGPVCLRENGKAKKPQLV
jgi:hypothetical protein